MVEGAELQVLVVVEADRPSSVGVARTHRREEAGSNTVVAGVDLHEGVEHRTELQGAEVLHRQAGPRPALRTLLVEELHIVEVAAVQAVLPAVAASQLEAEVACLAPVVVHLVEALPEADQVAAVHDD